MNSKLTEIHLNNDDPDDYYLGYSIDKNTVLTSLILLDDDGNEGGVAYFKNTAIKTLTNSENISFYQYLIDRDMSKDSFKLSDENSSIIKQHFSDFIQILTYALKNKMIISLIANDGYVYTGLITQLTNQEIRLRERNDSYELNKYETVIPVNDIIYVELNSAENKLFSTWMKDENHTQNDLNLVEIYLDYENDDRYGDFIPAKILAKNKNNLLIESYNELGQVNAISILNYNDITHITEESPTLDYYAFLIQRNEKEGILDPYALTQMWKMDTTVCDLNNVPTIEKLLNWKVNSKNLIAIDDITYDNYNLGCITDINKTTATQQVIDGYALSAERSYEIKDICALDLFSVELLQMQLFLTENKK